MQCEPKYQHRVIDNRAPSEKMSKCLDSHKPFPPKLLKLFPKFLERLLDRIDLVAQLGDFLLQLFYAFRINAAALVTYSALSVNG